MNTADLCDAYGDELQYLHPSTFRDFGGRKKFEGEISTVKCHDDNSKVKEALNEPGNGRVLVVDGAGSMSRALLGDNLAAAAIKNSWSGVVINGCLRDSEIISTMDIGVKALATNPRKTIKRNQGFRDVVVEFGEVSFSPGQYLCGDADGVVVAKTKLVYPRL
eukprot:Seg1737.7 transcript_id=Seg1737.7/GoldUCD/mRNA.D3Y31 product="putative 4-hydroxy-4-methyl-2-oxoglutarate aldolase" protein_id=Seg1737.7/GoldUCD/D3Y31